MNILKIFSPLLKEPELKTRLPTVIRVRKFDEASAKEFSELMTKAMDRGINLTQEDFDSAERAIELIEKTGKVYASGGMVGIGHLTRPLGNF